MKRMVVIGLILGLLAPVQALAHVTVQPNEAPTGSFFKFVVRVPNEKEDADTTKVQVTLPDLVFVSFQPKEGWDRKVTMRKLDEPIEVFGSEVDEVVDTITWSGGSIAPGEFDEFGFSARTPDEAGALTFPALQTYSNGEVVEWTGPADADEPAAQVNVIALGTEEGVGQLGLLAELNEELGASAEEPDEEEPADEAPIAEADDDDDEEESETPLVAWIALGLGALALIVALMGKRKTT